MPVASSVHETRQPCKDPYVCMVSGPRREANASAGSARSWSLNLMTWIGLLLMTCIFAPASAKEPAKDESFAYPVTPRTDVHDMLHGERVDDPYRWLEDDDAPEVIKWDKAQMNVVRSTLDGVEGRDAIAARIEEEFALDGIASLPRFSDKARWFRRRHKGQNHAALYRTNLEGTEKPRVVLDPNTWSKDGTEGLVSFEVSPDGKYVAYLRAPKGSENSTLYIRDVATGRDLPERIGRTKFSNIIWDRDSRGFMYSRMPDPELVPASETQHNRRIYHHTLGDVPIDDPIVWGRGRPALESSWCYRSADRKHVYVSHGLPYRAINTVEIEWNDGTAREIPIMSDAKDRTYIGRSGDYYVLNSDRHDGRREIYVSKVQENREPGPWERVAVPPSERGAIDNVHIVAGRHLLLQARDNVVSSLWVIPLESKDGTRKRRTIALPSPGTVSRIVTREGDSRVWLRFSSYSTPDSNWEVDLDDEQPTTRLVERLPTTIDLDRLVSERRIYKSKDGTDVPIFLLRLQDTPLDGSAPCVLYGYGGFRNSMTPRFGRASALWAEMGGIWAVACIRGGSEFGEAWHAAGAMGNKQNVFDDFIAAADWLVNENICTRDRLAIAGGSNGGLLTAVCVNQRPDLCRAAISAVPLTDMLRYHRFQFAKSWTLEYGDPDNPKHAQWLRKYSPYHNVKAGTAYPATLLTAGLHDGRVNALHARKMAAQWQHATTSTHRPILVRIDRESGHGAASMKQMRAQLLDRLMFLKRELGVR